MYIPRRTVLGAGAAAATTLAAGGIKASSLKPSSAKTAKAAPVVDEKRLVTLEEHFVVPSVVESNAITRDAAKWFQPKTRQALSDLGEGRLRDMDKNGITVQVLSASMPGADLLDGEEGVSFARRINDRLAETVRGRPDRFAGFAHLPMRSPEAAADELERAVSGLGFRGALINGLTQGLFLDNPRFAPILSRAAKLGVPLYLHPNFPPPAVMKAYYSDMPGETGRLLATGGFGWHSETGIHILRMGLKGTFEQHPGLNMIVGHMGEMIPFMLDRLDHVATSPNQANMGTVPSKIIRERLYITTAGVFSTPAFLCALTSLGADRIMFSVDYPYSAAEAAMDWFNHIPVSPADKLKIRHGNADRLLGLTNGEA